MFLAALDQTIIVASYGSISSDLGALNLSNWIATSYLLTVTSFQPLYGRLTDIFGRRPCLLSAYGIFGIGCIVCGLATNINVLIAARLFQGIGGGAMTTVVTIILNDIVPLEDLGVWHGVMNVIFATGSGIGAPLGKYLTMPRMHLVLIVNLNSKGGFYLILLAGDGEFEVSPPGKFLLHFDLM